MSGQPGERVLDNTRPLGYTMQGQSLSNTLPKRVLQDYKPPRPMAEWQRTPGREKGHQANFLLDSVRNLVQDHQSRAFSIKRIIVARRGHQDAAIVST
jgi:hypothetical protein